MLRDEKLEGQLYFYVKLYEDPPTAYHAPWEYGDGTGRHVDALTLAHIMTGTKRALDLAHELAALLVKWKGEKGLSGCPRETWTTPGHPASTAMWGLVRETEPDMQSAEICWTQRGTLIGLTSLYSLTGNELYRQRGAWLVDGLDEIALGGADYRFMPELVYRKGGWRFTEEPLTDGCSELNNGPVIHPLLRFYQATGYERAFRLAEGLVRFIVHRSEGYEPDGHFYKVKGY